MQGTLPFGSNTKENGTSRLHSFCNEIGAISPYCLHLLLCVLNFFWIPVSLYFPRHTYSPIRDILVFAFFCKLP
jgi:hypothetical protein